MINLRPNTSTRTIHFFKIRTESNFIELLRDLTALSGESMYLEGSICMLETSHETQIQKGIFAKVRWDDFPAKTTRGTKDIRDLNLRTNEGLMELTHFVYFAESSILAIEYNHIGARAAQFEALINSKISEGLLTHSFVNIDMILSDSFYQRMSDMGDIYKIQVEVKKDKIDQVRGIDSNMHAALEAAKNIGEVGIIDLVLKPQARSIKPLLKAGRRTNFLNRIMSFVRNTPLSETFENFHITALGRSNNRKTTFDLLEDKIESQIAVIKLNARGRRINSDDIYQKMKGAYNQKKDILLANS